SQRHPPTESHTLSLTRRSSDLNAVVRETFVIACAVVAHFERHHPAEFTALLSKLAIADEIAAFADAAARLYVPEPDPETQLIEQDRKSTRLNSSHVKISYAAFC